MPSPALGETFPVLKVMTRRQLEVLYLKNVALPDTVFRVLDLSQNLGFSSVSVDKMPCITPAGEKFLTKQVRFLTGIESMHFMGIYFPKKKMETYSSKFLQDLAGNAFETSSCSANLLCNMVFLACNHACTQILSVSPHVAAVACEFESEEADSEV